MDRAKPRKNSAGRSKKRFVVEDMTPVFNEYHKHLDPEDDSDFTRAPGHVNIDTIFCKGLQHCINSKERDEFVIIGLGLVAKIIQRVAESPDQDIKKYAPHTHEERLCSGCKLNHEGRDFIRAVLMYLIDELEAHPQYLDLLTSKGFLNKQKKEVMIEKMRREDR